MRIKDGRESVNIEDRRGSSGFGGIGAGKIGIGTVALAPIAMYFGVDPTVILQSSLQAPTPPSAPATRPLQGDQEAHFVSPVLADTKHTWRDIFRRNGRRYVDPKLVLFTGAAPTACGTGRSATGPFYCPADHEVYIDLSFYRDLRERFRALAIALSVRMELQADCFAAIWANQANRVRQIVERGDLESALTAAAAIGDDRLQKQAQADAVPQSFTHGSSEQRIRWSRRGFDNGDLRQCDTFAGAV